jgi:hypothetical protein
VELRGRGSLDAAGKAAEHEPGGGLIGCGRAAAEVAAAVKQLALRQSAQLVAEPIGRSHDHGAELRESFTSELRRATSNSRSAAQPAVSGSARGPSRAASKKAGKTGAVAAGICKRRSRSSDLARRVRWCRSEQGKPRRQDGNESRR